MSDAFCERCAGASSDQTPGNISTVNGIGRKFYGGANRCQDCGSVVRTLWFVLVDVPIVPLGSYRYKTLDADNPLNKTFVSRRTELQWGQVLTTWGVGLALGALAFYLIWRFA